VETILRGRGRRFDPALVDVFARLEGRFALTAQETAAPALIVAPGLSGGIALLSEPEKPKPSPAVPIIGGRAAY
jgi:hypothetical protein